MRRLLALGVAGAAAGIALWRRRGGAPAERVDLHFEDGSMVSLPAVSEDAERLLVLARDVLAAARS
ncbi:MAG TPA: hypothetical protein VFO88_03060 [Gaiellaceae bacterium]|nr:hypothetical protein [Gaiellaceae bacterium]